MIKDLFISIFEISLSTSLIIILLILFSAFLNKRYAAKWKYWLWIVLALRLILPFDRIEWPSVGEVRTQEADPVEVLSENELIGNQTGGIVLPQQVVVEIPAQMTTPIPALSETKHAAVTLLDVVVMVWFTGGLLFIGVHLFSCLLYKRQITKQGNVIEDYNVLYQLQKLRRELQIKHKVLAVEYPEAASPMIIGFFRPVLVLPEVQYSEGELSFILKHELVHLKRRDVYFKLLFVAANAVHWFNPAIWLMRREAFVDMELSCDERVIEGADYTVKKAYTETLFTTLHKKCGRRTALSTQFYGGTEIMKRRFLNILARTTKKNGILLLMGAVVLTISLGTLVGCSIGQADNAYPKYFAPIVQEIEAAWETNPDALGYYTGSWIEESIGVGAYKDKVFTAYIDGEYYPFDLKEELAGEAEWNWMAEGVFQREGEEEAYALLSDFNLTYSDELLKMRTPQLLFVEFSTEHPKDYQVTPYTVEPHGLFSWVDACYRLGDNIYILAAHNVHDELGVIDLDTRQFYHCVEECSVAEEYAHRYIQEKLAGERYSMSLFRAILDQDGVIVYSAKISDGLELPAVGLIFVAYKDNEPIAYMSVDLTVDEIADGIEVEIVE